MSYGQNFQVFNPQKFKKTEKELLGNKKKLEEMRLEEESQNTRLLKVQQKERNVDSEYKDRKKKMEETQEILAFEAQKFNDEQRRMNQELESKKDSLVMLNDRKQKQELERYQKEERQTKAKEVERLQALAEQELLRQEVESLEIKKKHHQQYEAFFKKVVTQTKELQSGQTDDENAIKELIDRYERLKAKEEEFKHERKEQERTKDMINMQISEVKARIEAETYEFTAKYNQLKTKIQEINNENHTKHKEIEGTQNMNEATQKEYIEVIHGIQNFRSMLKQGNKRIKMKQQGRENEIQGQEEPKKKKKDKRIDNQKLDKYLNDIKDEIQTLQLFKEVYDSQHSQLK